MWSFRSLVERRFHRLRIHGLIADHHLNGATGARLLDRQITQPDVLIQRGRGRSASHPSGRRAIDTNFVTIPRDTPPAHFKSDQFTADALLLLMLQRLPYDVLALV